MKGQLLFLDQFSGYPSREVGQRVKAYIDETVSEFAKGYRKGELGR